jgi:hypothetical protein
MKECESFSQRTPERRTSPLVTRALSNGQKDRGFDIAPQIYVGAMLMEKLNTMQKLGHCFPGEERNMLLEKVGD